MLGPIINLRLTAAARGANFSLADYKDAVELERKDPEIRRRRIEQGAPTVDMFNRAVAGTSVEFFQELIDNLSEKESRLRAQSV